MNRYREEILTTENAFIKNFNAFLDFLARPFRAFVGFVSEQVWGRLSDSFHVASSRIVARFYETRLSGLLIEPYCFWQYGDSKHYQRFLPGSGKEKFETFQDFFTRRFAEPPKITTSTAWPCEGFVCESGLVQDLPVVRVKGESRELKSIFGDAASEISDQYYFSNVYLHNNNYHHIHAPVDGTVSRIEHIPGQLLFLRPWAYQTKPSLPALTNERVNVDIVDRQGKKWFLSIVGGPLVATINLPDFMKVGKEIQIGQMIASFALGSTCCVASPYPPAAPVGESVRVGEALSTVRF
ncbi:MAG: phosphatidylserine decarboxylase [Deltaproteobacteria bacterium]|nr:phosphatidylserine decarboxylase [Deltaproteobacteria bacterium]